MHKEKIFEVKLRKDIYNYIKKNPGVHFREIKRSLNMPLSTLEYHIKYLVKRELLSKESKNGYLRFYVLQKIGRNDKKLLNILREPVPRNIVLYLFLYYHFSQKELIIFAEKWKNHPSKMGYHLDKHRTTLIFHIKKLVEEDVLEPLKVNFFNRSNNSSELRYRLKNPEKILDLIIKYDKSILSKAYGRFLKYVYDKYEHDWIDDIIKNFFDIFPIPYRS